ncbi:AraC family transcriptional regulator [Sesbania bispinosa]|nr:AraC family transcriptional regulator [Sesbania bispinosa]
MEVDCCSTYMFFVFVAHKTCRLTGCSVAMDLTAVEVDFCSTGPPPLAVGFSHVVSDEYKEQMDEGSPNTPSSPVMRMLRCTTPSRRSTQVVSPPCTAVTILTQPGRSCDMHAYVFIGCLWIPITLIAQVEKWSMAYGGLEPWL